MHGAGMLSAALNGLAASVRELVRATGAALAVMDGEELVCMDQSGEVGPQVGMHLALHNTPWADAVSQGIPWHCPDAEKISSTQVAAWFGIGSILVVPLRTRTDALAVLFLFSRSPYYFDDVRIQAAEQAVSAALQPEPGTHLPSPRYDFPDEPASDSEPLATAPQEEEAHGDWLMMATDSSPHSARWMFVAAAILVGFMVGALFFIFQSDEAVAPPPEAAVAAAAATQPAAEPPAQTAAPLAASVTRVLDPQAAAGNYSGQPRLRNVEVWSSPGYSRVTIELDKRTGFSEMRLKDPYRAVFDLKDMCVNPNFSKDSLPVNDDVLQAVRWGQHSPGVARVVLDLKQTADLKASMDPKQPRLIVEIYDKGLGKQ